LILLRQPSLVRARAKSLADARKRQEALFKRIDADLQKLEPG
jgi:hypothetical protein